MNFSTVSAKQFFWKNKVSKFLFCAALGLTQSCAMVCPAAAQVTDAANENAPAVMKTEPPNWWVGLTSEVMVLLSGKHLDATHVSCNLDSVKVARTQSTAGGSYLFVWLRIAGDAKSGTAVCRVATPNGATSFELPLAAKTAWLGPRGLSADDVIYLIMPDRFANGDPTNDSPAEAPGTFDRGKARGYHGGDLAGVRAHLDYLKDLGVNTLWLTPVVKNGGLQDYHGYGAVDLYAVDPHLGSVAEYRELVNAAHAQQMKVFFDVVPNHVGPKHPWAANPPLPDWFHGSVSHHANSATPVKDAFYGKPPKAAIENDAFEVIVDPHADPQLTRTLTEGWFAGILPDLNTENPVVAQYLLQNSIWWVQTAALDGFRIDTFPYVSRRFWEGWHAGLHRLYPNLSTIGEVFHPDPTVTSFFVGGQRRYDGIDTGLTTVFDFPMYFTLRNVLLHDAPAGKIADVLRHDSLYLHPDELVTFFANHDVTRFAGVEGSSTAKLELAFGLNFTLRGIPEFYYGDEIGMVGGGDPDNRRDFPGGWIGDAKNAFTAEGRNAQQEEIFEYVRTLLKVRREHGALRGGKLWHVAADDTAYVFVRESEDERLLVAFNNAASARELQVGTQQFGARGAVSGAAIFGKATAESVAGGLKLKMPAQSLSIFVLQ